MPSITEGALTFEFPAGWVVEKYDATAFHRNRFSNACGGCKAVDVVAVDPRNRLWLIEVTDYRGPHPGPKPEDLPMEAAHKVRDTLAGLLAASHHANDAAERQLARQAVGAAGLRVVLHLEVPTHPSRLNSTAPDPATVLQGLKQLLKPIDPHAEVVSASDSGHLPWSIS